MNPCKGNCQLFMRNHLFSQSIQIRDRQLVRSCRPLFSVPLIRFPIPPGEAPAGKPPGHPSPYLSVPGHPSVQHRIESGGVVGMDEMGQLMKNDIIQAEGRQGQQGCVEGDRPHTRRAAAPSGSHAPYPQLGIRHPVRGSQRV